jgi:hypothetical protein
MKGSICFSVFAFFVLAFCSSACAQDFNPQPWLDDFNQLKLELSEKYANLDWAVETRKVDLKQLSENTAVRLSQARSELEARRIIETFLGAFGDGHLVVQWVSNVKDISSSSSDVSATDTALPLCQRLGFEAQKFRSRLDFGQLSNFHVIDVSDSRYFPIGILRVSSTKDVGVIRIPIFSEYAFPELCEDALVKVGLSTNSACDEACADRVERTSANQLTETLVRQIRILIQRNISALVVDITSNGGGTNWIEPAARTLSAKSLNSPRQQFIRHEHWTQQLEKRLKVIESDLSSNTTRITLRTGLEVIKKAVEESRKHCTRDAVWENGKPKCSLVANTPVLYPQSVLPYAKPGLLPDKPSSQILFYPSRYQYREGVYAGLLVVLVDADTWSSAEYFAAMLRDNNAAIILGSPTGGAGCGYTNGGIPSNLKNSRGTVKIPDCVRLRADGTNEVAGITPDILIPWRANDSSYQRAGRVLEVLSKRVNRLAFTKNH